MAGSSPPALAIVPARSRARTLLEPHAAALVPGTLVVALMLLWAAHNGGYDADTWYWGALLLLGVLAALLITGIGRLRLNGAAGLALAGLAGYTAWSYLSIAWAGSPGDALEGSNRTLLYLLIFALMSSLPWTPRALLAALVLYAVGIGVIGLVILLRLAADNDVTSLVIHGRLDSPTGYFNSTVALFMIGALLATALAAQRELPGLLRGVLIAVASAGLQLAVIGQSRGWLFTLPIVVIAAITVARDRLRVAAAAVLPIVATLIPVHRLIGVFDASETAALQGAAKRAGHAALLLDAAMFVLGTLIAWAESVFRPTMSARRRRQVGIVTVVIALVFGGAGVLAATSGHPFAFAKRQWEGFTKPPTGSVTGSHFATVGSGRYDVWRVSLDALAHYPIGGLGQDNFTDYYITRRHTDEEPKWTHSIEMRLLAMNGLVGFALFGMFLVAAVLAAVRVRNGVRNSGGDDSGSTESGSEQSRTTELGAAMAGIAMLPLVVWLIHGSVDWFWEMPALTGPALGFLGAAIALAPAPTESSVQRRVRAAPGWIKGVAGALALIAAVVVLGFPYLAVREFSTASNLRSRNPNAALRDLKTAAKLNPLNPQPGLLGGTIALESGYLNEAETRFRQAISREPGGWFPYFGEGLAASALGDSARAKQDFEMAHAINSRSDAVQKALAQVESDHPLSPATALSMLVLAT
jgi:hypothetical protein